jgi:hypothetical protein
MPHSTGMCGTQFSTFKIAGINDPEGPENITTLKWSTGQLFTVATRQLTPAVVKYKILANKNQSKKFKEPAESTNHIFGIWNKKGTLVSQKKSLWWV